MNTSTLSYDESFTLILNLLEKAEQILSIINLSDSAVSKYNQLKQLTFQKLNLNFTPLIKRVSTSPIPQQRPQINTLPLIQTMYLQGIKKTMLIDVFFDYMMNQNKETDINCYISQLDSIFNVGFNTVANKTLDDFEYDTKVQEQKIKDMFITFDQLLRKKTNLVQEIVCDYEHKISDMKAFYDKEIMKLKETVDKSTIVEKDLLAVRKQNDINVYLLDKMSQMISSTYDKYFQKNSSWYGSEHYSDNLSNDINNYPDLDKLKFVTCLVDKFYTDNKYLSDLVPSLQKEKLELKEEHSLPYVSNAIARNDLLKEICKEVDEVDRSGDAFHKNFEELINYISINIEGKVM